MASSVANSPSSLACPFPDPDPDTIHGVPLANLLARCQSIAHRYHRQHGRWEPYEEYLSAAHMALTQCMQTYKPEMAPPGGFLSYSLFRVAMACRYVRRVAAGSWNMAKAVKGQYMQPKYAVESWEHTQLYALRPEQARQETCVYLGEVLAFVARHGTPAKMLLATTVDGESVGVVATRWGCTDQNVKGHCMKLRRKLRAWAHAIADVAEAN